MTPSIAVLLTCHNRRDTTLACLTRLFSLSTPVTVYCTDDASTDGTPEAIRLSFPEVHLLQGDGNLFWCRGMNKAWQEALKDNYDFYCWLNDDLVLYDDSLNELLACSALQHHRAVVCGLVQESTTGRVIYGGITSQGTLAVPDGTMQRLHHINGNLVLVPREVVDKIGIFDPVYHHDLGDVDYGLTAQHAGFAVVSTRSYVGATASALKSSHARNRRNGVTLTQRFRALYSPLGSPPPLTFHFLKKHRGLFPALAYYLYVHVINVLPDSVWRYINPNRKT